MTPHYINRSLFFCIQIGKWAEDLGMSAKDICDVITNHKGYYKEVFDYWPFMKRKIIAMHRQQNPNYMPTGSGMDTKALQMMLGSRG